MHNRKQTVVDVVISLVQVEGIADMARVRALTPRQLVATCRGRHPQIAVADCMVTVREQVPGEGIIKEQQVIIKAL